MLNDLYFKTTCNTIPHFLGPMGGLKIERALYFGSLQLNPRMGKARVVVELIRWDGGGGRGGGAPETKYCWFG